MTTITTGNIVCLVRITKSGAYTVTKNDSLIGCDTTGGAFTITLPLANTFQPGQYVNIKDEGGSASSNNITVDTTSSQTIDGETEITINGNYDNVSIYSDGNSSWFIY